MAGDLEDSARFVCKLLNLKENRDFTVVSAMLHTCNFLVVLITHCLLVLELMNNDFSLKCI